MQKMRSFITALLPGSAALDTAYASSAHANRLITVPTTVLKTETPNAFKM